MTTLDIYEKLMIHFSQMGMITSPREDLLTILKLLANKILANRRLKKY
ncbi:MAG: hypothetical protein ACFE8C_05020 [Promethearchaeota archaeon]